MLCYCELGSTTRTPVPLCLVHAHMTLPTHPAHEKKLGQHNTQSHFFTVPHVEVLTVLEGVDLLCPFFTVLTSEGSSHGSILSSCPLYAIWVFTVMTPLDPRDRSSEPTGACLPCPTPRGSGAGGKSSTRRDGEK